MQNSGSRITASWLKKEDTEDHDLLVITSRHSNPLSTSEKMKEMDIDDLDDLLAETNSTRHRLFIGPLMQLSIWRNENETVDLLFSRVDLESRGGTASKTETG